MLAGASPRQFMSLLSREASLILTASGAAFAAAALLYRQLARPYAALLTYLIFEVAQDLLLLQRTGVPRYYFYWWAISQAVACGFQVMVARELVGLLVKSYAGIARVTRWFYIASLVVAVAVAMGIAWSGFAAQASTELARWQDQTLVYLRLTVAVVLCGTLVFLGLIGIFLLWFPFRLSRNVAHHYLIFLIYVFGETTGYLLHRVAAQQANTRLITLLFLLLSLGAFLAWATMLRRQELDKVVQTRRPGSVREQELTAKLATINRVLVRTLDHV